MSIEAIPEGYDALIPSLIVRDGAKAIEFYKEVFGAAEVMRMNHPGSSKIAHAEIKIRDHILMLGDECPEMGALAPAEGVKMPPQSVMIYFPDVDAIYTKALSKSAKSIMAPMDMFWGDRMAKFTDPFGHVWGIATRTKVVSKAECDAAMASWAKQKPEAAAVA